MKRLPQENEEDAMWHLRTIFAVLAGILLVCVPGIHADSLQLKNGNFVQGKYLGGTERAVQFEVNGRVRLYDIDEILSISFAAASAEGGIPSNGVEPKPNANTELNSASTDNRGIHTVRSKQISSAKISVVPIAQRQELDGRTVKLTAGRSADRSGSKCAIEANPQTKAPVPAIVARPARIPPQRLSVLSD
jgi:hypothetical protein